MGSQATRISAPPDPIALPPGFGVSVFSADILKTALAPTWNDILLLAALIALRTVLSYLLEAELEKLGARRVLAAGDGDQPGK